MIHLMKKRSVFGIFLLTAVFLMGTMFAIVKADEFATLYIYHNNESTECSVNLNQGDKLYFGFTVSNGFLTTSAIDPFGNQLITPFLGELKDSEMMIEAQNTGVYKIQFSRGDNLGPDGKVLTTATTINLHYGIVRYNPPTYTPPNNSNPTSSNPFNATNIAIILLVLAIIIIPAAIILSRRGKQSVKP